MSVPVRLAKARTTCDFKTGQVEIIWLENATSVDGFLGKDVLASGSTKNVYQVRTMVLMIRLVVIGSHLLAFHWLRSFCCKEVF